MHASGILADLKNRKCQNIASQHNVDLSNGVTSKFRSLTVIALHSHSGAEVNLKYM